MATWQSLEARGELANSSFVPYHRRETAHDPDAKSRRARVGLIGERQGRRLPNPSPCSVTLFCTKPAARPNPAWPGAASPCPSVAVVDASLWTSSFHPNRRTNVGSLPMRSPTHSLKGSAAHCPECKRYASIRTAAASWRYAPGLGFGAKPARRWSRIKCRPLAEAACINEGQDKATAHALGTAEKAHNAH